MLVLVKITTADFSQAHCSVKNCKYTAVIKTVDKFTSVLNIEVCYTLSGTMQPLQPHTVLSCTLQSHIPCSHVYCRHVHCSYVYWIHMHCSWIHGSNITNNAVIYITDIITSGLKIAILYIPSHTIQTLQPNTLQSLHWSPLYCSQVNCSNKY